MTKIHLRGINRNYETSLFDTVLDLNKNCQVVDTIDDIGLQVSNPGSMQFTRSS